ncbi:MAG: peptidyl-prolyl cis-trans isomerase [Bdellovibrionales bacterium CG12_big_fil_rev_8_21_14_0_65_38_15]|nr:MAG: peptidyl-prolyl cis-trans isomerase [Bdellovibrionales bacterium CG22_combo_CG10-13_8_21_14_all_38_13]PIQ57285.1 MAG: peptidyl-prolyl cis-trans isomerase [Bdellovibrionales bacterium CG12_big_fil_rev_8_21_14_0_65_38_15]PIR28831.1 MAG: peptidyl-prolyl cis-trans isomerase [Bdellovibrionales bacterium CG11_big_fil_rev_8_21_14_0_20_38_13]
MDITKLTEEPLMSKLNRYLAAICLLTLTLMGGMACTKKEANTDSEQTLSSGLKSDSNGLSVAKATIKTVHGNIVFKFYPNKAPNTVNRIVELIKTGFYDGLIFHRVVPNFVAQGGDPTGTGTGGSGKKLKAEFNDIQHIRGTVAMARASEPDSADSQFYIALTTLPHLDGNYTVFGQVVEGLDLLDKIQKDDKMLNVVVEE